MGSEGDRGRAKNKLALLLGMQGKKERTAFEVKRPGADGTVGRPSDDLCLSTCAVSLTAQHGKQDSATITGGRLEQIAASTA